MTASIAMVRTRAAFFAYNLALSFVLVWLCMTWAGVALPVWIWPALVVVVGVGTCAYRPPSKGGN